MNHEPDFLVCPLLSAGRAADPAPCLEERCAWWHTYQRGNEYKDSCCALLSAADHLADMNLIGVDVHGD